VPGISHADQPTARRPGLRPGTWRRWLAASAAPAAVLALAGLAVASGPAADAAKTPYTVQKTPPISATSPIDQFRGVSCSSGSSCTAAGWYVGTDGVQHALAEQWNGKSWRATRPADKAGAIVSLLTGVACTSASSCQAVGRSGRTAGGSGSVIAESWNGKSWRLVPIPVPGGTSLDAISCGSAISCFAVGSRGIKNGLVEAVTMRWNGREWSAVTPRRPQPSTLLEGVACAGPRNCYATGSQRPRSGPGRALIEHWNGTRWSTQPVSGAPANSDFSAVSCPTATACTAAGSAVKRTSRLLIADLASGKWTAKPVTAPSAVAAGDPGFYAISCGQPRVCTALLGYINSAEEATFATAARGRSGGFKVGIPAGDVAHDDANGISCRGSGCTIAGALNDNDGQGDQSTTGTAFAWRGSGNSFKPQTVVHRRASDGGFLEQVSCAASGFCAASTSSQIGVQQPVDHGQPAILARPAAGRAWQVPAGAVFGQITGLSCTSARFCLAIRQGGVQRWNGSRWSAAAAPPGPATSFQASGEQGVSCVSPAFCMAVGLTSGLNARTAAAIWNGSGWTTSRPAAPAGGALFAQLDGVSCPSAKVCFANGWYTKSGHNGPLGLIEKWNGTRWSVVGPRMTLDFVLSISMSCATGSACMASWGDISGVARARWWNGKTWAGTTFAGPSSRTTARSILAVSCGSADSCTAVGSLQAGGPLTPLIEHWNGKAWSVTPSAVPALGQVTLTGVSCTRATVCTAVGSNARVFAIPFAEARSK
jgi:hypothetical protein